MLRALPEYFIGEKEQDVNVDERSSEDENSDCVLLSSSDSEIDEQLYNLVY